MNFYSLSAYQFDLPPELIAQKPAPSRENSRLLVVDRKRQEIFEIPFKELQDFLNPGDQLVLNDTKVIPARLKGRRVSGGQVEVLLSKPLLNEEWEVLCRPAKKILVGTRLIFGDDFEAEVLEDLGEGLKRLRFFHKGPFEEQLNRYGQIPLPPYIRKGEAQEEDLSRYQTLFAKHSGAVAAPTAGLHFSHEMLHAMEEKGVDEIKITLHVGLGTFRLVQHEDIREHFMHYERYSISEEAALKLNQRREGGRQICVGTTSCRCLESVFAKEGKIVAGAAETNLFIYPGYNFGYVKSLLTNFHVPGSSLLMLVSALGGYDLIKEAYCYAIKERFRFYSYGDAMLIL